MKTKQQYLFDEIVQQWGFSSVQLKNYLTEFYTEDLNYATKDCDFDLNRLIPYRKSGFLYGTYGLDILKLAIKIKIYLMYQADNNFTYDKFAFETLRLFIRIDSKYTNENGQLVPVISFNDFEIYIKSIYNGFMDYVYADSVYVYKKSIYEDYLKKAKIYKKIKYHYTKEDFINAGFIMQLSEYNRLEKVYQEWLNTEYIDVKLKAKKQGLNDPTKLSFRSFKNALSKFGYIKQKHTKK